MPVMPVVEPIEPLRRRVIEPVTPPVVIEPAVHIVVETEPSTRQGWTDWSAITTGLADITTQARPTTKKVKAEKVVSTLEAMQNFFNFFDSDRNGKVSKKEIKYVFLKKLDTDGDYSVSPRELFKGTARFLEKICQSEDFKQSMYEEEVDSGYLALGIIDWDNQQKNYQNCLTGISLYTGAMKHTNCNKWLGFNPLDHLKEFRSRYSLFKFLDQDGDGQMNESEFVDRATQLIDEEGDNHYKFFTESIELYGKQFCKDPRVRPFETLQSVCEIKALKKLDLNATTAEKLAAA